MKAKRFFIVVMIAVFAASITASVTAFAANKEKTVTEKLTDNGEIAIDQVKLIGENTDCYTVMDPSGSLVLANETATAVQKYYQFGSQVKKSDITENAYVEITFDVLRMGLNTWFWFNGFTNGVLSNTDDAGNVFMAYLYSIGMAGIVSGPEGAAFQNADGTPAGGWIAHNMRESDVTNYVAAHGKLTAKFEFYQDGTIKMYVGAIQRSGDELPAAPFALRAIAVNAYAYNGILTNYGFSFGISNASATELLEVDNYTVKVIDGSAEKTVTEVDFEDFSKIVEDPTAVDEIAAVNYTAVSGLRVKNPAADNRVATLSKLGFDENATVCFDLETEMSIEELPEGKSVGFAFGLVSRDAALDTATYVYLTNDSGETFIGSSVKGVEGERVTLGKNIVGDGWYEVAVTCDNNKVITFSIAGVDYAVTADSVEDYLAITQSGEGDCEYLLSPKFSVINYTYRAGEGESLEHPFNTDYLDDELYTIQSTVTAHIEDVSLATGLEIEGGKLVFNGTAIHTHFATAKTYADFILQLDYTTVAIADRPAVGDVGGTFGYSPLGIAFGKPEALSVWTSNHLFYIRDTYTYNENFAPSYIQFYKDGVYSSTVATATRVDASADTEGAIASFAKHGDETYYYTMQTIEGKPTLYNATTRIKIVAINNHVTLWMVNLDEEGNPVGDFVKLFDENVKDTYGYISLSTDANGFFTIDNLRITNYDAETFAGMTEEEILADYDDFKVLADVVAPTRIGTPVLTLNGNVVSWEAIEYAAGYIVSVNGVEKPRQTETSYTVTDTEAGNYVITVRAVSDGDKLHLDGFASQSVTYVVEGEQKSEDDCSGCGGVTESGLFGIMAMAAALLIKRRR